MGNEIFKVYLYYNVGTLIFEKFFKGIAIPTNGGIYIPIEYQM